MATSMKTADFSNDVIQNKEKWRQWTIFLSIKLGSESFNILWSLRIMATSIKTADFSNNVIQNKEKWGHSTIFFVN